ncbi:hypothetical protein [Polaromonas sp. CF318]|uniref:hypothetical protein n=1 Tax=Polaromonas sp. CF318 TaxID=1144318 RepID=UPI0012F82612|nr:hypothetical protein [Polaromonas sp. CF318]
MALRSSDVSLGTIAFFDDKLLLAEHDIDAGDTSLDRPGPFVCVQVMGAKSVWCAITSEYRPERLFIEPKWRQHGSDKWKEDNQYLNDGLNTFLGPNVAFLRAAAKESPFNMYRRPKINAEGVAAILFEVDKQGGPLF